MPTNHFDGINEHGNLSYWKTIGRLDFGDGTNVPLDINFNSSRNSVSSYLGQGWVLPLLESNVVQIDSKHFAMMQPDGLLIRFKRKDETSSTLTGQGGWMAEIDEHTFTAWAKCGWKIVFSDGKIASIGTPTNHQISYEYEGGIVKEIDFDGAPVLRVLSDASGVVSGLSFNGKQISFKDGPKPGVEMINGHRVIGHLENALAGVTMTDGQTELYKFSVDAELNPTLFVSGATDRMFSWDPVSSLLLKDGSWSYNITPADSMFDDAQIQRKDSAGKTEYWYDDKKTGQETMLTSDGSKTIVRKFTSGILRGAIRDITRISASGASQLLLSKTYSEKGMVLRESIASANGLITKTYNDKGLITGETYPDGKSIGFVYDDKNNLVGIKMTNGVEVTTTSLGFAGKQ